MVKQISCFVFVVLLLAACGKSEAPAQGKAEKQTTSMPKVASDSTDAAPPPPGAPVVTRAEAVPLEGDYKKDPHSLSDLDSLNLAVRDFIRAYGKPPRSVEELVDKKVIPRLPAAPPGKKYSFDETTKTVVLAGP